MRTKRVSSPEEEFMKRTIKTGLGAVFAITLCWVIFLTFQTEVYAKSVTTLEGAKLDVSISLKDNLKFYVGKDVFIHLRSGKTIQGYVKSVGSDFVHLEKLAGRDFYDALVRIEDISAMEVKFRDIK
jgi:hypothetical protein